jgi:glycerol-3-phosphate dehydrogenase (NAD(P)+)
MIDNEKKKVGIIGSGSFGIAIANLICKNRDVLIYSRKNENVDSINHNHKVKEYALDPKIIATNDASFFAASCELIFPIVPSEHFRKVIKEFAPYLRPYHFMVHGTKGLDLINIDLNNSKKYTITRSNIATMSEVILQETSVLRVGCLSGPNLASEILKGLPTATVVASRFDEVIDMSQNVLNSNRFHVFGTYEILGAEIAGALKNVIAMGSGILDGHGLGKNIQAMLITRGLNEMIKIGNALGASNRAFLGTAGIGDLIATATSTNSRNYTFGLRIAKGENIDEIKKSMTEFAEGIRTLQISMGLIKTYNIHAPIFVMLHKVIFEGYPLEKAIDYLMEFPYDVDVDFL